MSGLYLFLLLSIWGLTGWVIYKLWFWLKNRAPKLMLIHIGITIVFFGIWFGWPFWEMFGKKIYWDAQVRELCGIDGGVKVYEKVVLPEVLYDQYVKNNWVLPDKARIKKTDRYYSEYEIHYFRKVNPIVSRRQYRIIRRSDTKILGESIRYGRGGGDLPGPWHSSSFTCPSPTEKPYLEPSIFIKEN